MCEVIPLENDHYWLEQIRAITGSDARTLFGALADSGNPAVAACPDEISEIVASKYAISSCGRLFHWRYGRIKEIASIPRKTNTGEGRYFEIRALGHRWTAGQSELLDRVFPDRALESPPEIDWAEYDPNESIPGLVDPLRDRELPNSAVVTKRTATREEIDRVWRSWYSS